MEQEKDQKELSYEERLAMAMESMRGCLLHSDTDIDEPFSGDINGDLVRELHELLRRGKE